MDNFVIHNDRLIEAAEAKVAATLAGIQYGWGVFTALGIFAGEVFAFPRYWDRLLRHAEKARLAVPMEQEEVNACLASLIKANSVITGRARLTILKGETGTWRASQESRSELLIFTTSEQPRRNLELTLTLSPYRILSSNPLAGVKRTSMLENLLALEEARNRNFDEAVMLNERGEMVSATAGNLFWVEGSELFTPSLATGCIAGITRAFVLECARRVNIHTTEGSFPITRLLDANEVFLTSTTRGITPVKSYDIKTFDPRDAVMTRNLAYQFQKLIGDAKITL